MEKESRLIRDWPISAKILASSFLLLILVGYGVTFLMVHHKTGFKVEETVRYYRGDSMEAGSVPDPLEALHLPKSYGEILEVTHVHTLIQPLLLLAVGALFYFCAVRERVKIAAYLIASIGLLLSNAAPWLIRYGGAEAVYLYPFSNVLLMGGLGTMTVRLLYEMWSP